MLSTEKEFATSPLSRADILHLTPDAMAALGLETHVYVRPVRAGDVEPALAGKIEVKPDTLLYAVHAANGTCLAIVDSCAGAFQGARAYGYEPLSVH